jgi:hypothetical protein
MLDHCLDGTHGGVLCRGPLHMPTAHRLASCHFLKGKPDAASSNHNEPLQHTRQEEGTPCSRV